jgi:hypothetical protein
MAGKKPKSQNNTNKNKSLLASVRKHVIPYLFNAFFLPSITVSVPVVIDISVSMSVHTHSYQYPRGVLSADGDVGPESLVLAQDSTTFDYSLKKHSSSLHAEAIAPPD